MGAEDRQTQTGQQFLTLKVEVDVIMSQTCRAVDINNLPQHMLTGWTLPSPGVCWAGRDGNSRSWWGMSQDNLTPALTTRLTPPSPTTQHRHGESSRLSVSGESELIKKCESAGGCNPYNQPQSQVETFSGLLLLGH